MHLKKKKKNYWNFGYSQGEDTGQALSWGRSLANSSNLSWAFALVPARPGPGTRLSGIAPSLQQFSLEICTTN